MLLCIRLRCVMKINVHGMVDENLHPNGVDNSIRLVARDWDGKFLLGLMGLLVEMEDFQS